MKVKQLKKLIENLEDNTIVLVPGGDHGYYEAWASSETALQEDGGTWTEDHGEKLTPESIFGKRKFAVIIGPG